MLVNLVQQTQGVESMLVQDSGAHPTNNLKGSYIEVYSGIEFPKHDFQFNYDTKCRVYVAILHHSGLSYKMF